MNADLGRWSHHDGCAVCPRCNKFVPCEDDLAAIAAAAAGHDCQADPGTGHYLRPPDVAEAGWYWAEPDGTYTATTGRFGRPVIR